MILARVGVLSAGKVMGACYALLGLIMGAFFALISMLGGAVDLAEKGNGAALPFAGAGVMAIVMFPIMYGIIGFIGGIISAAIYNLFAGMVGGLEMDFAPPGAGTHGP